MARRHRVILAAAVAAAVVMAALVLPTVRPTPPQPEASDVPLVQDDAGLLSDAAQQAVTRYHRHLLADFDIDYRVVIAAGLGDIDRAAVERFRAMGRQSLSGSGRGLLLLVDPAADRVRLEVGYPLEGVFTDAFVDYVERRQLVPFFERDRIADGILATTELIVGRAQQDYRSMGTADGVASSGGAGAATDARLGAGAQPSADDPEVTVRPGAQPQATLDAYLQAMAAHDGRPDLPIYTPATQRMLEGWLVTPAQMDNALRTARRCPPGTALTSADGGRAVIRYPASSRQCAPYFLERRDGLWRLDLAAMQQAIRFNTRNQWHFVAPGEHPYAFAFHDWGFDASGYPRISGESTATPPR